MTIPSKSPISPGYGFGSTLPPYSSASPHNGVDFLHVPDDTIYAPFAGKVIHGFNARDGNGSYMYAPNGDFHGMLHASKYLVADNAQVSEGQAIAVMGETGFAQGVHLHWCVKRGNVFIDPMKLVSNNGGEVMLDKQQIIVIYDLAFDTEDYQVNPDVIKAFTGKPVNELLNFLHSDPSWIAHKEKVNNPPASGVNHDTALKYVQDNLK